MLFVHEMSDEFRPLEQTDIFGRLVQEAKTFFVLLLYSVVRNWSYTQMKRRQPSNSFELKNQTEHHVCNYYTEQAPSIEAGHHSTSGGHTLQRQPDTEEDGPMYTLKFCIHCQQIPFSNPKVTLSLPSVYLGQ